MSSDRPRNETVKLFSDSHSLEKYQHESSDVVTNISQEKK